MSIYEFSNISDSVLTDKTSFHKYRIDRWKSDDPLPEFYLSSAVEEWITFLNTVQTKWVDSWGSPGIIHQTRVISERKERKKREYKALSIAEKILFLKKRFLSNHLKEKKSKEDEKRRKFNSDSMKWNMCRRYVPYVPPSYILEECVEISRQVEVHPPITGVKRSDFLLSVNSYDMDYITSISNLGDCNLVLDCNGLIISSVKPGETVDLPYLPRFKLVVCDVSIRLGKEDRDSNKVARVKVDGLKYPKTFPYSECRSMFWNRKYIINGATIGLWYTDFSVIERYCDKVESVLDEYMIKDLRRELVGYLG